MFLNLAFHFNIHFHSTLMIGRYCMQNLSAHRRFYTRNFYFHHRALYITLYVLFEKEKQNTNSLSIPPSQTCNRFLTAVNIRILASGLPSLSIVSCPLNPSFRRPRPFRFVWSTDICFFSVRLRPLRTTVDDLAAGKASTTHDFCLRKVFVGPDHIGWLLDIMLFVYVVVVRCISQRRHQVFAHSIYKRSVNERKLKRTTQHFEWFACSPAADSLRSIFISSMCIARDYNMYTLSIIVQAQKQNHRHARQRTVASNALLPTTNTHILCTNDTIHLPCPG